ncbi:phage tail protein [Metaclostridioides mangenotii]|uniref:phage tail protein n=1 Tax=Metaclostridioides mangenotii TaxID=1540 RepID=UPI00068A1AE6|nr:phage tail protein [Clostridioides mangenotii]
MEQFYTILTEIGKAKIANATVLGEKVDLTKFQVGDSNGQYYNPSETQTALKNKVWESNITSITTDENNPSWVVIFATIPGNVGGFNIREAGVFDSEGNLIAFSKLPETYKPTADNGSTKDLTIKIILEVSNAEVVTIKVDPTVILASKKDLQVLETKMNTKIDTIKTDLGKKIDKVATDLGNIELTGNKVTIEDTESNFTSGTVEGALKELATKDKTLQTNIANNKTETDKDIASLKQSVSSGKQLIATAVTGKDVPTNGSDTFQKMADNIDSIIVRSPIAEDEIGVVQWEDGSYKGFKETSFNSITLPISEQKNTKKDLSFSMDRMNMDKERNSYCSRYARYKADSILKKISINGTVLWQYQFNGWVERVVFDGNGHFITTGDGSSETKTLVYKFTLNGDLIWVKEFPVSIIQAFTTDDEFNVYIGYFSHADGERLIKLDGNTGEEMKSIVVTNGIYAMDYNAKQNMIAVATGNAMSIYDKQLNLIKTAVTSTSNQVIFHDDGSVTRSVSGSMSYLDSNLTQIWGYSFGANLYAVVTNSLLDHFVCANNEITRHNKFGSKLMTFPRSTNGNTVMLGENLISCVTNNGYVFFLQDNFKVTENIVVKTIYDTI